MQLQKALIALQVLDAGVVMGTEANQVLRQSDVLTQDALAARAEDLVVSVRAEDSASSRAALDQIDSLLAHRATLLDIEFRPRSLESALQQLPSPVDSRLRSRSVRGRSGARGSSSTAAFFSIATTSPSRTKSNSNRRPADRFCS
jgi:hypothetical protein